VRRSGDALKLVRLLDTDEERFTVSHMENGKQQRLPRKSFTD
jgi:hypothetical protein